MKICPLSLKCIPAERYCFYFYSPSSGIGGNLTFKIAIQKFIHYIQKFIRFVVALILMFHIALFLLFVIAKIATIFEYPNKFLLLSKNLCSGSLKIAIRHPKISVLKISVHSLKIAGLKIIARVCVRVYACAPHLANISKIVQDATRAGTQRPERPPANAGTQRPPQEQHQSRSDHHRHPAHAHPIRKRKLKNNSKLIFF